MKSVTAARTWAIYTRCRPRRLRHVVYHGGAHATGDFYFKIVGPPSRGNWVKVCASGVSGIGMDHSFGFIYVYAIMYELRVTVHARACVVLQWRFVVGAVSLADLGSSGWSFSTVVSGCGTFQRYKSGIATSIEIVVNSDLCFLSRNPDINSVRSRDI